MLRAGIALVVLTAFAAVASSQPRQPQLALSPGVMPASPFGPGTQFLSPRFAPPLSGAPWCSSFPVFLPGYGFYFNSGPYDYRTYPVPLVIEAITPSPARPADPVIVLAQEFPATLSVQFPAAAVVWLDGVKLKGDANTDRVLTSPVLKPGQRYTFEVKARWKSDGKTYETKRAVTLGAGDKSRLLILSGDKVRE